MSSPKRLSLVAAALLANAAVVPAQDAPRGAGAPAAIQKMQLTSTAFDEGRAIPREHSFDDKNLSPALKWSGVPPAAKSLALICDDPDAPAGTWVHWVIFDMPPTSPGLPEGVPNTIQLDDGSKQGVNDFKQIGYGGPAPPPGKVHRYYFKIYALDQVIDLRPGVTKAQLLEAMKDHILARGQLMGTYKSR